MNKEIIPTNTKIGKAITTSPLSNSITKMNGNKMIEKKILAIPQVAPIAKTKSFPNTISIKMKNKMFNMIYVPPL